MQLVNVCHTTVGNQKTTVISGVIMVVDIDSCFDTDLVFIKYIIIQNTIINLTLSGKYSLIVQ